MHLLVRPAGEASRLGLTVSRKVGHALARNRLRRRIREIFRRQLRFELEGRGRPVDVVVRALPGAAACSHAELPTELLGLACRWDPRRGRRTGRRSERPVKGR